MNEDQLKVAKTAAKEAGKVIKRYSDQYGEKLIKGGDKSDFATMADLQAEKKIISLIQKNFPQHNIISEEQENKINHGSQYTWVIDPLDGTFSFSKNLPQFSVSVGLMQNNKPVLGVVYHIATGEMFWAQTGKGAYVNGRSISVSATGSLAEAGLYLDFGHKSRRQSKFDLYIKSLMHKTGGIYSLGSAALGLAWIGKGILDGNVNEAFIWDFVAGTVIVREAGGRVTDFEGNEPDWNKERFEIVASNGLIHDAILEALKQ